MDDVKGFWKQVFSTTGSQSFGRVGAMIALVLGCAWITRLVLLIAAPEQFDKLSSIAMFIGAVTGMVVSIYGMGKINETISDKKTEKGVGDATPPTAPV